MRQYLWHGIWFYRRKLKGSRKIPGLVLDVGSGNAPHPRADVLVEKYLTDDQNRIRGAEAVLAAPIVACDAEALPFADKAFDFVICSHLIEHVDHPDLVLNELQRVGKAGYLECPNEAYDKLDTPSYHRWFANFDGQTLEMRQKSRATFDPAVSQLVHQTLQRDQGFWAAFWRHLERFFVMYRWEGEISYRVDYLPLPDGSPGSAEKSLFDDEKWIAENGFAVAETGEKPPPTGVARALKRAFWQALRAAAHPGGGGFDLFEILACPADRNKLERGRDENLVCSKCGAVYPVVDGIPFVYPKGKDFPG